jgi:hypothetical protein
LAAVANCEAPGGYNYNRPSFGGGVSAGGNSFGGGSAISSGGNYQQEAIGGSTNEGMVVDPQLLDQIRQILLREESQNGGSGGASQPSSQYGAPQAQYGPPQQQAARVVGIVLENTIPSIQVAQYRSQSQSAGGVAGGFSGYPSGPSSNFGVAPSVNAPSSNYGAPAPSRPSSNYGAPF